MKRCEIFHVPYRGSFRWKWRHVEANGRVKESPSEYELFYDCVLSARASGYEPQSILPAKNPAPA